MLRTIVRMAGAATILTLVVGAGAGAHAGIACEIDARAFCRYVEWPASLQACRTETPDECELVLLDDSDPDDLSVFRMHVFSAEPRDVTVEPACKAGLRDCLKSSFEQVERRASALFGGSTDGTELNDELAGICIRAAFDRGGIRISANPCAAVDGAWTEIPVPSGETSVRRVGEFFVAIENLSGSTPRLDEEAGYRSFTMTRW